MYMGTLGKRQQQHDFETTLLPIVPTCLAENKTRDEFAAAKITGGRQILLQQILRKEIVKTGKKRQKRDFTRPRRRVVVPVGFHPQIFDAINA